MLQIVVIGYKNHAERVINILCEMPSVKSVIVYYPDSTKTRVLADGAHFKIKYTSVWDNLMDSDAFFICSPSETHIDYILKILDFVSKNNSFPYIYCEKPPGISKKDLQWLKSMKLKLHNNLYFGFNYRFSSLYMHLKKTIESRKLGAPIYANFTASHGLAFKKGMAKNWRFSDPSVFSKITGNLGIHYVDMCLGLFGSIKNISITEQNVAKNSQPDTAIIRLFFESGIICNIFLSYATIFSQSTDVFFTNGLLKENNGMVDIFYPRDTFNALNEFCLPKAINLENNFEFKNSEFGLKESIYYFVSKVEKGSFLNKKEFDQSIKATEVFLGFSFK